MLLFPSDDLRADDGGERAVVCKVGDVLRSLDWAVFLLQDLFREEFSLRLGQRRKLHLSHRVEKGEGARLRLEVFKAVRPQRQEQASPVIHRSELQQKTQVCPVVGVIDNQQRWIVAKLFETLLGELRGAREEAHSDARRCGFVGFAGLLQDPPVATAGWTGEEDKERRLGGCALL